MARNLLWIPNLVLQERRLLMNIVCTPVPYVQVILLYTTLPTAAMALRLSPAFGTKPLALDFLCHTDARPMKLKPYDKYANRNSDFMDAHPFILAVLSIACNHLQSVSISPLRREPAS